MKVLVINCGSSSLKYQLIDSDTQEVLAKGLCERIGIEGSAIVHQPGSAPKVKTEADMPDHTAAVRLVLEKLTDASVGVIGSLDEIDAVGHRIVHGGEKFAGSVVITDEVIKEIEKCSDLAPLHNPANLIGIHSCREIMPGVPMVGVFDTAFHQTMPKKAYLYGLPHEYYEQYQVRRYGFHGTSHDFVSERAAQILGKSRDDLKIIVCHLGNGASISAVDHGKSVDTSMGMTPLEGLIMGTRSGDLDPAVIPFLAARLGISAEEVVDICNKKSGVLGLSGLSSDFRDLEEGANSGNNEGYRPNCRR
jgi:acetate kinase